MLRLHLQLGKILSFFVSEGPAGLTSVPSAGRGAATELRAKAWQPARLRGTSTAVAISDALRLWAGLT
jgi:hypothetical protein